MPAPIPRPSGHLHPQVSTADAVLLLERALRDPDPHQPGQEPDAGYVNERVAQVTRRYRALTMQHLARARPGDTR